MKRPVEILVQQAREDSESESYLPKRLAKLGLSAVIAAKFAAYPFFSQILTSLLSNFSSRAEARLLTIAEELEAQQARIADLLEDKTFYESEEFQTLFALVLREFTQRTSRRSLGSSETPWPIRRSQAMDIKKKRRLYEFSAISASTISRPSATIG